MRENNIRILFTGVGRRVELIQAFREAALILDQKLKIYGADSSASAPALAFCDFGRIICQMKEEQYIDELLRICRDDAIDLVIPTIDTDLMVLSENKDEFDHAGIKVLVSSAEVIKICRDKNSTSKFFIDCGLKAPMPIHDWTKYTDGYPAFIKPKDGSSSIDAYKAENEDELKAFASRITDYMIQPFIDGTEYTVDIFVDFNGNPVFITPRIRLAVRAGEVLKTQINMDQKIIGECKKIISALHPCGPITVQLIRERETEDDYFIEINPRFGGGAPLSMKAGAKSAETLLLMLNENKTLNHSGRKAKSPQIQDGDVYSRFDQSVCIKRGKKQFLAKGVVFDLDDTLYSEKEYVKSGYRSIAKFLGNEDIEDCLWDYFKSGKPVIDECLKELGKAELKRKCLEIYRNHYPDIHLYDGVAELIGNLKENGIQVGVITDGRPEGQRNKIAALGLDRLISDIVVTDELGGVQFRKPCDIAFRIMALRWKLPYEEIVYVGDNVAKDFQAPRQLGMQSIWFRNNEGIYSAKYMDCQGVSIDNLADLKKLIIVMDERD